MNFDTIRGYSAESEYNSCLRYVFAAVCFRFVTMPANLLEFPHVYAQFRQASPLRAEAALATPQRRKYFMEPGRQVVEHFGPDLVSYAVLAVLGSVAFGPQELQGPPD